MGTTGQMSGSPSTQDGLPLGAIGPAARGDFGEVADLPRLK